LLPGKGPIATTPDSDLVAQVGEGPETGRISN
jgi:hypothetical protein